MKKVLIVLLSLTFIFVACGDKVSSENHAEIYDDFKRAETANLEKGLESEGYSVDDTEVYFKYEGGSIKNYSELNWVEKSKFINDEFYLMSLANSSYKSGRIIGVGDVLILIVVEINGESNGRVTIEEYSSDSQYIRGVMLNVVDEGFEVNNLNYTGIIDEEFYTDYTDEINNAVNETYSNLNKILK